MNLSDLIEAKNTLNEISEKDEIEFTTAYKLAKLNSEVEEGYSFFTTELNKLLEKYAVKDDSGNVASTDGNVQIASEYISIFNEKIKKLESVEVSMPETRLSFSNLEHIKLSMKQVKSLLPFIDEDK